MTKSKFRGYLHLSRGSLYLLQISARQGVIRRLEFFTRYVLEMRLFSVHSLKWLVVAFVITNLDLLIRTLIKTTIMSLFRMLILNLVITLMVLVFLLSTSTSIDLLKFGHLSSVLDSIFPSFPPKRDVPDDNLFKEVSEDGVDYDHKNYIESEGHSHICHQGIEIQNPLVV